MSQALFLEQIRRIFVGSPNSSCGGLREQAGTPSRPRSLGGVEPGPLPAEIGDQGNSGSASGSRRPGAAPRPPGSCRAARPRLAPVYFPSGVPGRAYVDSHNLTEDIGEKNDLASEHPDKVKERQGAWDR
jgi:hypothetical protein